MEDNLPAEQAAPYAKSRLTSGLSRNVVVLGAVSFCTDISSEMLAPIRFLFLVFTLGTPLVIAGLIEGMAESLSAILRIVSGRLADRLSRRKPLILAGYSLSNGVKPLLAFVLSWEPAFGLILLDRVGKAIRGTPRDAVIADSTPAENRGKAFGFHRGMDTLGAAVGPLLTVAILQRSGVDLRPVFAWTVIPGAAAVLILLIFLRERPLDRRVPVIESVASKPLVAGKASALGAPFWLFTGISAVFALGNSSDAFIFLRTQGLEQSLEAVPLAYFGFNVVYALLSTPLGHLSDRIGRGPLLFAGYLAFALVYAGWARANQGWNVWVLFLFYGIYAAAIEGAGKAYITDLIPREQRGSGLGWYNATIGFAALPANVLAGWLWSQYGPQAPFQVGSALGFVAALLLALFVDWRPRAAVPATAGS